MIPRSLVVFLLFAATISAPAKELSGRELRTFLGPVPETLATWDKDFEGQVEIYLGRANPPVSGDVSIMIISNRWHNMAGLYQQPKVGGRDRLGVLHGELSIRGSNGAYGRHFSFADTDDRWMWVNVNSPVEADAERLFAEISRLPMFNATPATPFHEIVMWENIALSINYFFFPVLLLLSVWLLDRFLRRRKASGLRRALTAAGGFAGWILLFLGLFVVSRFSAPAGAILYATPGSFLAPALAILFLAAAILAVVWLLVRWTFRPQVANP
jgi:hypothetical protein